MVLSALVLALNIAHQNPDKSSVLSKFVNVNGVKLHYLDWGGVGDPVVFLAGTGDNAYAFEEMAPRFVDRYRVIALTRRGFGRSDKPVSGYDVPTLSQDVLGALDELGIEKAHIICHSAGGDETTYIASKFPNRVLKIVYMDAAYNRTTVAKLESLDPMGAATPSSREQELHWKGMDAFVPDFKAIKAPVLNFYAIMDKHPAVDEKTLARQKQKAEKFFQESIRPYQLGNIAQFRKDLPSAKVVLLRDTDHYFFEDPKIKDNVVKTIREFLDGNG